jgi:opacity protein-like surface antigen
MLIRKRCLAIILALALVPAAAYAQQTQNTTREDVERDTPQDAIIPFIGVNGGGSLFGDLNVTEDLSSSPKSYGASLLFWGPGLLAGELDFGYNPDFYEGLDIVAPTASSNMLTLTLNFVIGPTFFVGDNMRIRPYGLVGGGLMRSEISDFIAISPLSTSDRRNQGVVDIAGGVYFYPIKRIGIRGDVRYFMGIGSNDSDDGWGSIEGWNYYRITVGAAIAF